MFRNSVRLLTLAWLVVTASGVIQAQRQPRAELERFWVDFDVYRESTKGMLLHIKMTVYDMKSVRSAVRVMFFDEDNKPLVDRNKKYFTTKGNVAAFRSLQIDYNPGYYDDLQIFMPYEELDLGGFPGEYRLKMDVDLVYEDTGELIQHLTFYDFDYSEPNLAPVDKVWVDYNATEDGRKGMRVHLKFKVYGLKKVDSYLAVYVSRLDNTPVAGKTKTYMSKNGQLASFQSMNPCCAETVYDDLSVFIPYDEFSLPPGEHNLRLDIDLIYPDGKLIQHLKFYDFVFTRRW